MEKYYNGKICTNGHIVDFGKGSIDHYCIQCGKDVISECSNCSSLIRGSKKIVSGDIYGAVAYYQPELKYMTKPYYCYCCGVPHQWTQLIIDNAVEILSLDESVGEDVKDIIKKSIPDLIVDSPTTSVSVTKFKINYEKLADPIKAGISQLLIDVVSDVVRKGIF